MVSALFFLLLILLGAALFSIASGFCICPAVQRAVFELFAPANDGSCDMAKLQGIRRLFVSRKIRIRRGRRSLSGWLFLPAAQGMSVSRILIFAPEGKPLSAADLGFFLEAGFLSRAGSAEAFSVALPAVFLPFPSELFVAGSFFSFGAKEAAALNAWSRFFSRAFPSASVFFCGKGLGASSALFAAARLARRAAGRRCNLGGVIAHAPCLSAAQSMKRVAREYFPRRALYIPVYAGARLASIFCGLGAGGRNARRALKRVLALKKKHSDIVIALSAKEYTSTDPDPAQCL